VILRPLEDRVEVGHALANLGNEVGTLVGRLRAGVESCAKAVANLADLVLDLFTGREDDKDLLVDLLVGLGVDDGLR